MGRRLTGVARHYNLPVGRYGHQIVANEHSFDVHKHRPRDVPLGVVFSRAQTDDIRIIVRVTIVQQFKQIGGLDRLRSLTEIGYDHRLQRLLCLPNGGNNSHQQG